MELQLERSVSLLDLRKTQRRVTALITNTHPDLLRHPLRRRILPQGFCYVCSRIDPGGLFRNQNSYLYQKGFFHACEHLPNAPQPSFVGEEIKIDLNRERTSTATETVELSINVTIKHEPDSGRFVTPTRKEKTGVSSRGPIKCDNAHVAPSVKYNSGTKRLLPAIGLPKRGESFTERKPKKEPKAAILTEQPVRSKTLSSIDLRASGSKSRNSGLVKTVSSARESDKFSNYDTDRVTIIPTALDDEPTKSDFTTTPRGTENTQTITFMKDAATATVGGFTPTEGGATTTAGGVTPTAREGTTTVGGLTSTVGGPTSTVGGATTDDNYETPFINKSDGLGSMYSVEPLIKEVVLLEDSRHGNFPHKMHVARGREKHGTEPTVLERPESGHLRYHHRSDEDSVPAPGFEIPPTPSIEERLQLQREEQARKEAERREIEHEIAQGNVFVDGSIDDDDHLDSQSDDTSLRLTDGRSAKSSHRTGPGPTMSSASRASFCRCPSNTREASFMKSTCLICGKGIIYGQARKSRDSSFSQNEAGAAASMRTPAAISNRSRQQMLHQSKQQAAKSKAKSVSDEDYMDLESIIHEDDGRYWSSDEEDLETQFMSRSAALRYRHAKPFPLVDPNLHKMVYIKSLHEAHLRTAIEEGEDEFNVLEKLRHPFTFSYFPLLAGSKKENGDRSKLGLRAPDETVNIKGGQFMRHIFGDVDMEKYYQKSSRRVRKHSILDITDTALISTDRMTVEPSNKSPRAMANIPGEDERTSVSLKMKKSGVNFENRPQ